MDSISWVDIGIILVYLAGMVAIGIWTSRKVKNLEDYSLAGKSLGYVVMIGTLVGAAIGAASTMGKAGKAYEMGIIFITAGFGYIAGLIVFGLLSGRLRQLGIWTIPEALYKRYGKGINLACGAAMFITVIALFGGQIIGIGLIFTAVGTIARPHLYHIHHPGRRHHDPLYRAGRPFSGCLYRPDTDRYHAGEHRHHTAGIYPGQRFRGGPGGRLAGCRHGHRGQHIPCLPGIDLDHRFLLLPGGSRVYGSGPMPPAAER